jgi:DNA-binding transcriptional LysR family regulator
VRSAVKVSNRERILARLNNNEDDLYILGQPPEEIDAVAEPFLANPLIVLAPVNHPLARVKNIPLKRLAEEPFLLREAGSGTRIATEQLFARHNLKIRVRMELGSNEAIKQAVVGGLGISVLSRHTLPPDVTAEQIVLLDVRGFPIERHWHVAYPKGKQLSVVAHTFLDYLKQAHLHIGQASPRGAEARTSLGDGRSRRHNKADTANAAKTIKPTKKKRGPGLSDEPVSVN